MSQIEYSSKKAFSFEFFPPQTDQGMSNLLSTAGRLAPLRPDFFSITYGAGGSTRDRTYNGVMAIENLTKTPVAPHISCIGDSKKQLASMLELYQNLGIKRIVALRGDLPSGMGGRAGGELQHANELVRFIRETTDDQFHIEVAAYPEAHPQADNIHQDVLHLKGKFEAGANSAITQYFFNPDAYFSFIDYCQKLGIEAPIVPGIMPIINYTKLVRFSKACGAEIPLWMRRRFESYGDDSQSIKQFGEECISNLCEKLLTQKVPGLHFYTLNQPQACLAIWDNLKLGQYRL